MKDHGVLIWDYLGISRDLEDYGRDLEGLKGTSGFPFGTISGLS